MILHGFRPLAKGLEAECGVVEHGGILPKILERGSCGGKTLVGPPHIAEANEPLLNQNSIFRKSTSGGFISRFSFWYSTGP